MEKTYYIEASRHVKNEYRIAGEAFRDEFCKAGEKELPAYTKMVGWMKGQIEKAGNKLLPVSYSEEQEMNIISNERTVSPVIYKVLEDKDIVRQAERPFDDVKRPVPFETKGYDLGEDAYYFASVDSYRTVKPYRAESPEKVLKMAENEQLHNVLVKVEPERQFLHSSKDDKVTLQNGKVVEIFTEKDFINKLKNKFPEGMTVRLADESFKNLVEYKEKSADITAEMDDWMGLANPGNTHMLVAHGTLSAELKLQPKDYDYVFACDQTYYDDDLYDLIQDNGIVATSMLLADEPKMEAMRVVVLKMMNLEDRLFIEGKPFKDIMQLAERTGVKNDDDLHFQLNKEYIGQQPAWLRKMAEEQTAPQRQQFFVNKVMKAIAQLHEAEEKACEEAAEMYGIGSAHQLKEMLAKPDNIPADMLDKVIQAASYIEDRTKPYREEQNRVSVQFTRFVVAKEAEFIRKFNRFGREAVNDVCYYPDKGGNWNVRCKIDGQQQMAKALSAGDSVFHKGQDMKELSFKYFKNEIVSAMDTEQKIGKGLKM